MIPPNRRRRIDAHTQHASMVAQREYFIVAAESENEVPGLLVGTAVKKLKDPKPSPSDRWLNRTYWTVLVQCPNGEERNVSVTCLLPGAQILFEQQCEMFAPFRAAREAAEAAIAEAVA